MSTQKFTHLLLTQCKSQTKYWNIEIGHPQYLLLCCEVFRSNLNMLTNTRVVIESLFLRFTMVPLCCDRCECWWAAENTGLHRKVWLWLDSDLSTSPPAAPQPSGEAAAAVMELAQRRGRLKNKAGEQNHCMSDFWAIVLSQVWTRLDWTLSCLVVSANTGLLKEMIESLTALKLFFCDCFLLFFFLFLLFPAEFVRCQAFSEKKNTKHGQLLVPDRV